MWPDAATAPGVKVCGLTRPEDAEAAARLGAWGIGVVLAEASPRRVDAAGAAAVCAAVPSGVARVGVFVDASPAEVASVVAAAGLTHAQLHGAMDPAAVREAAGVPVIQGIRVDGPAALDRARASDADMVLLDAAVAGMHGGTGTAFDWSLLEDGRLGRPFALAGGLRPDTVAGAVARTAPLLVDVSSGVESAPGVKDHALVAAFLAAVAGARPRAAA